MFSDYAEILGTHSLSLSFIGSTFSSTKTHLRAIPIKGGSGATFHKKVEHQHVSISVLGSIHQNKTRKKNNFLNFLSWCDHADLFYLPRFWDICLHNFCPQPDSEKKNCVCGCHGFEKNHILKNSTATSHSTNSVLVALDNPHHAVNSYHWDYFFSKTEFQCSQQDEVYVFFYLHYSN